MLDIPKRMLPEEKTKVPKSRKEAPSSSEGTYLLLHPYACAS